MKVSDVMSTNVISIPSTTSLAEARRIMDVHHFRRLPVIDRGKLVGVVSRDGLDRMGPSQMTTFSVHEISYLLNKITVNEVMRREVVTVTPTTLVDDAVDLAQSKGVGILVVLDGEDVVGVATTNDFFYKLLNPMLGIKMSGTRIYVQKCYKPSDIEKVMAAIKKFKVKISSLFLINIIEINNTQELVLHLDTENCSECIEAIRALGYQVAEKSH